MGPLPYYAGLVSAIYMRDGQEVASPDPAAGLYIRDRRGRAVSARIPSHHLAFQMGQAMQVCDGPSWAERPLRVR